jgi:hypothetical protein
MSIGATAVAEWQREGALSGVFWRVGVQKGRLGNWLEEGEAELAGLEVGR